MPIVRNRPAGESSCTSPNPMVVSVMNVIYTPSIQLQPSMK